MTYAHSHTFEPARLARPPPHPRSAARARRAAGFDGDLVALLPSLRAFAHSLCGNAAEAEDLVQGACENAMAHADSFACGTNMRAWLFTILRNQFYSQMRKRRREVEDAEGKYAGGLTAPPGQDHSLDLSDVMNALARLRDGHREVLLLVGQEGLTYEEAAQRSHCAVGTIKSRVHRARSRLAELLA